MESSFNGGVNGNVSDFWWSINNTCFLGEGIDPTTGLFMSAANLISSGSVFTLKKKILGKIIDCNLIFSHDTLTKLLNGFPELNTVSAEPPCVAQWSAASSAGLTAFGDAMLGSNLGKINAQLQVLFKQAQSLNVSITKWGTDSIEQGLFSIFLKKELATDPANPVVKLLTDGNHYIAVIGVWVTGININYGFDGQVMTEIKAIYDGVKGDLLKAGITFDFSSQTTLATNLTYTAKFYPFLKFRKIDNSGNINISFATGAETFALSDVDFQP